MNIWPYRSRPNLLAICAWAAFASVTPAFADQSMPLQVGQAAPDFTLPVTGSDDLVQLSTVVSMGPAVVVVLRGFPGYQCPLCSRQVGELIEKADQFRQLATKVILVYPGEPTLLEQHAAEFQNPALLPESFVLVRDPGYKMVKSYHLRWDADQETAYPSTFVIGKDQKIAWQTISKTHGGRAEVGDVLEALRSL